MKAREREPQTMNNQLGKKTGNDPAQLAVFFLISFAALLPSVNADGPELNKSQQKNAVWACQTISVTADDPKDLDLNKDGSPDVTLSKIGAGKVSFFTKSDDDDLVSKFSGKDVPAKATLNCFNKETGKEETVVKDVMVKIKSDKEITFCGDGLPQPPEECDDANLVSGDGCSKECKKEKCGDGTVQELLGEECDDKNTSNNDGCSSTCKIEKCGDGVTQQNEECDDGNASDDDGCSILCKKEICGDAIQQKKEECDDGNTQNNDNCSSLCQNEKCGDGFLQVSLGEDCDDGNSIEDDACNTSCELPKCGDKIVQTALGEECDKGPGGDTTTCTAKCTNIVQQKCEKFSDAEKYSCLVNEDGTCQQWEYPCHKDDPQVLSKNGDYCKNNNDKCIPPVCGNGKIEGENEECDDGAKNGEDKACTSKCKAANCGDEKVGPGEECDKGKENGKADSDCSISCKNTKKSICKLSCEATAPQAGDNEFSVSCAGISEDPQGNDISWDFQGIGGVDGAMIASNSTGANGTAIGHCVRGSGTNASVKIGMKTDDASCSQSVTFVCPGSCGEYVENDGGVYACPDNHTCTAVQGGLQGWDNQNGVCFCLYSQDDPNSDFCEEI